MWQVLQKLWNDESGISSVEYALLLAFVAGGIIASAELLANAIGEEMGEVARCISQGTTAGGGC